MDYRKTIMYIALIICLTYLGCYKYHVDYEDRNSIRAFKFKAMTLAEQGILSEESAVKIALSVK